MDRPVKKSVFHSFLISYLILMIIIMMINIPMNYFLNQHIAQQNEKINEYVLTEIEKEFDTYFSGLKTAIYNIGKYLESDFKSILEQEEPSNYDYYTARKFRQAVSDSLNYESYSLNAGVYYYDRDIILSDCGIYPSKDYFDMMYGKGNERYYNWLDKLKNGSQYYLYEADENRRMLTCRLDYSKKGSIQRDVIVFAEIDVNRFQEKIEFVRSKTGGNVVVFDKNRENIIAGDGTADPETILNNINKKGTVVKWLESPDKTWNYAVYFDEWEYMKKTRTLFIIEIICFLLCLAAAVFYILYASKKHTRPIKELAERLAKNNGKRVSNENEFSMIGRNIDELLERSFKYDSQNRHNVEIIKQQLLTNLLSGNFKSNDILLFDKYYTQLNHECFFVAVVELKKGCEQVISEYGFESSDIEVIFINILEELINDVYAGAVVHIGKRFYCVINMDEPASAIDIKNIFEHAQELIRQYFRLEFSVAISADVRGCEELSAAVSQAETMLHLMKLRQTDGVVLHEDICSQKDSGADFGHMRNKLKNYLYKADSHAACELFDEWLVNQLLQSETIENISVLLISYMTYIIDSLVSGEEGELAKRFDPVSNLLPCASVEELREKVHTYFESIAEFAAGKEKKEDIAEKVCSYINQNYQDPELTVTKLGEVFNFHSVYLSRLFKEKRNESIPEYLTNTRIANAKRLLRETDDTIEHIAMLSGYTNVNTFNRVFKKTEGVTPGAYRR